MNNLKEIVTTLAVLGGGTLVVSGCGKEMPATEVPGDAGGGVDGGGEASCSGEHEEGSCSGDPGEGSCSGDPSEGSCSGEPEEGSCSGEATEDPAGTNT